MDRSSIPDLSHIASSSDAGIRLTEEEVPEGRLQRQAPAGSIVSLNNEHPLRGSVSSKSRNESRQVSYVAEDGALIPDILDGIPEGDVATSRTRSIYPHPSVQERIDSKAIRRSVSSVASTSSWRTFVTARSSFLGRKNETRNSTGAWSFQSAKSYSSIIKNSILSTQESQKSEWKRYLEERNLIVDEFNELNWSGRGQHVEFLDNEVSDIPLTPVKVLGHTSNAFVEGVLCRRILLARKTINCHKRLTREDAIKEVEHLQRLKNTHIVQVVGSYIFGKNLSILLYPVAEYNLKDFLEELLESKRDDKFKAMENSIRGFFGCLSSTISFIHAARTKHLDIKPMNILVRDMGTTGIRTRPGFPVLLRHKIIIADFGIARSYESEEETETETAMSSFTRMYSAPEVVDRARRGLSADIFSLGCVFAEVLAVLANITNDYYFRTQWTDDLQPKPYTDHWFRLRYIRSINTCGDRSYQANVPGILQCVVEACQDLSNRRKILTRNEFDRVRDVVCAMLAVNPQDRPSASDVEGYFKSMNFFFPCACLKEPDPFEIAEKYL